jgi:hypothetical protein
VGPRARLDAGDEEKKYITVPAGNRTPAIQPVAYSLY